MARKSRPVLPGQSRSTACSTTCGRLRGHKGTHRPTMSARTATASPKVATVRKVSQPRVKVVDLGNGKFMVELLPPVRKTRRPKVRVVPEVAVDRTQFIGRARRARRAPQGTQITAVEQALQQAQA